MSSVAAPECVRRAKVHRRASYQGPAAAHRGAGVKVVARSSLSAYDGADLSNAATSAPGARLSPPSLSIAGRPEVLVASQGGPWYYYYYYYDPRATGVPQRYAPSATPHSRLAPPPQQHLAAARENERVCFDQAMTTGAPVAVPPPPPPPPPATQVMIRGGTAPPPPPTPTTTTALFGDPPAYVAPRRLVHPRGGGGRDAPVHYYPDDEGSLYDEKASYRRALEEARVGAGGRGYSSPVLADVQQQDYYSRRPLSSDVAQRRDDDVRAGHLHHHHHHHSPYGEQQTPSHHYIATTTTTNNPEEDEDEEDEVPCCFSDDERQLYHHHHALYYTDQTSNLRRVATRAPTTAVVAAVTPPPPTAFRPFVAGAEERRQLVAFSTTHSASLRGAPPPPRERRSERVATTTMTWSRASSQDVAPERDAYSNGNTQCGDSRLFEIRYINLAKRGARRARTEAWLRATGLGGVASRFEALTGDEAPDAVVAREWDSRLNARYDETTLPHPRVPLTSGERGCAMSHACLWASRAAAPDDAAPLVVLEDDVEVANPVGFSTRLRNAIFEVERAFAPDQRAVLLYLGADVAEWASPKDNARKHELKKHADSLFRLRGGGGGQRVSSSSDGEEGNTHHPQQQPFVDHDSKGKRSPDGGPRGGVVVELLQANYLWQTSSYVLWPAAARALVASLPIAEPVDNYISRLVLEGRLVALVCVPHLCRQTNAYCDGDILHSRPAVAAPHAARPDDVPLAPIYRGW